MLINSTYSKGPNSQKNNCLPRLLQFQILLDLTAGLKHRKTIQIKNTDKIKSNQPAKMPSGTVSHASPGTHEGWPTSRRNGTLSSNYIRTMELDTKKEKAIQEQMSTPSSHRD